MMRLGRISSALAALLMLGICATARADAPFGPKVGTKAPAIGALADADGKPRQVQDLAGSKGVVVMFFRSARWCPFCQAQLIAMNEGAAQIESLGYKIVGISYEPPENSKPFIERRAITYSLLYDKDSKVIDRWGLRDPQYPAGNMAFGVPRPIIFILDRKGVIRGSIAEETYRTRPPVSEVVKLIGSVK